MINIIMMCTDHVISLSSPHRQVGSTSICQYCCVSAKYTLPLPVICNYAKYDVAINLTLSDDKYHHDVY